MRLLICTQAVDSDDPVLGFFHRWIEEFAKHCESIEIICLRAGVQHLPDNVHIHSLGKEKMSANSEQRTANRIQYAFQFWRHMWRLRGEYDAVFVHMNPEYVLLGGLLWRLWRKRVVLWYVHRQNSFTLRLATHLVHRIATSARGSISAKSEKIVVVGHGIDTSSFSESSVAVIDRTAPKIVTVGRISPIKSVETIVEAIAHLGEVHVHASLDIVGPTLYEGDIRYKNEIEALVRKKNLSDRVSILPAIPNSHMPTLYRKYDIAINACPTGGIDKAVLEAMAAGKPVFVCNESFREYLGAYAEDLIFAFENSTDLAGKIATFLSREDTAAVRENMRSLARAHADVRNLIPALLRLYDTNR